MRATYTRFENRHSKGFFSFFSFFQGAGEKRAERSIFRLPGLQPAHASSQPFVSRDDLQCLRRGLPPSLLPPASPRLACGFVANHKGNKKHTRKTACYAGYYKNTRNKSPENIGNGLRSTIFLWYVCLTHYIS